MEKYKELISPDYAKRLKEFRTGVLKITQEQLVDSIDQITFKIDQSVIGRYETGKRKIPTDFIKELKRVHQLSYEWFFDGEGSPTAKTVKESGLIKDMLTTKDNVILISAELKSLKKEFIKLHSEFHQYKHAIK